MVKVKANPYINGWLLIDKPVNWTSHDVVAKLRNIFGQRRVGHSGTLDPFATGLLIIGFGQVTKYLDNFQALTKVYRATIRLGWATQTDDLTGDIVDNLKPKSSYNKLKSIDRSKIAEVIASFKGFQYQKPSNFSAKKIQGKKAYELARQEQNFELPLSPIYIYDLLIEKIYQTNKYIDIVAYIECSSGTYIRALARDIGQVLEVGGHLQSLRRLKIGQYDVKQALIIDNLTNLVLKDNSKKCCKNSRNDNKDTKIINNFNNLALSVNLIPAINYGATIGKFATLHKGHIALIHKLVKVCLVKRLKPRIIIIEPDRILDSNLSDFNYQIQSKVKQLREKILRSLGVQRIDYLKLDSDLKKFDYKTFAKEYLVKKYNVKYLLMGDNATIGKNQLGHIKNLASLKYFEVEAFKLLPGISSSKIRQLVKENNLNKATELLGRQIDILC
ncbi:MAG: tRNA pseudouridine(55) synthase TruB [Bifidobacteriaceae bacterium]|jgi:tRNA pseudouridine55 synthase|nr:tRNA pseudouridine(55) synthase TruB [Bifidobacteriaceae bacterium]